MSWPGTSVWAGDAREDKGWEGVGPPVARTMCVHVHVLVNVEGAFDRTMYIDVKVN